MASDLEERNIGIMIQEAQRMQTEVGELRADHQALREDFTTLMFEFAELKKKIVMDAVERQMADKGHGGTA